MLNSIIIIMVIVLKLRRDGQRELVDFTVRMVTEETERKFLVELQCPGTRYPGGQGLINYKTYDPSVALPTLPYREPREPTR